MESLYKQNYPLRLTDNRSCQLTAEQKHGKLWRKQYTYTLTALTNELVEFSPFGEVQRPQCWELAKQYLTKHWKLGEAKPLEEAENFFSGAVEKLFTELHPITRKTTEAVRELKERLRESRGEIDWQSAEKRLASILLERKMRRVLHPTDKQVNRWRRRAYVQAVEIITDLFESKKTYASGTVVNARVEQNERNAEYLRSITLCTEDGEEMTLSKAARTASQRFAECYAIVKGMERIADKDGLHGSFITCTLPPEFHPNPTQGRNSWAGWTAEEAQRLITARWQRVRSLLHKRGIKDFGLRAAEPHKDGCPHAHFLLWAKQQELAEIERAFRLEFGQSEQAVKVELIDKSKGSAASYVSKYIRKTLSLDGSALEVDAWRACWGIRAFQFFGLPRRALTHWREFRRVDSEPTEKVPAAIWRAARRGDAEGFIRLMRKHTGEFQLIERTRVYRVGSHVIEMVKQVGIIHNPSRWRAITHRDYERVIVISNLPSRKRKRDDGGGGGPPKWQIQPLMTIWARV